MTGRGRMSAARYRCQLLKDFAAGKISADEAMKLVSEAREMRTGIVWNDYMMFQAHQKQFRSGSCSGFWAVKGRRPTVVCRPGWSADMLVARCNIFEALLIKTFRSADDFDKLVMK